MDHPLGLAPPEEWWSEQRGHATAEEFRTWLSRTRAENPKTSKYGAQRVYLEDLDLWVRSKLEARTIRLLQFTGYAYWTDKTKNPPAEGRWFRYEGRRFDLEKRNKAGTLTAIDHYLIDLELWDNQSYALWECKGKLDARSKRHLKLMAQHHPDIPLELITKGELETRVADAMRAARRKGWHGTQIPGWQG